MSWRASFQGACGGGYAPVDGQQRLTVTRIHTYKRHAAVRAPADLRLVDVDEDARVSQRPAAAIACHHAFVRPPHRLLVDQLNGRRRRRL